MKSAAVGIVLAMYDEAGETGGVGAGDERGER